MSNWREQIAEDTGFGRLTTWIGRYYHYVVLALLAVFMFWNRGRFWQRYIVNGDVLYQGNDAWYHLRNVQYTVEHFPATMQFDPWTYFPKGTANAQFGTLYDQIVATIAMIVGLGNPSDFVVRMVVLFAPVIFGTAVMVPAYLIGRRLGDRPGGLMSAAVVAFGGGVFLRRSVLGFSDHHIAEALFQALAVLGVIVALSVAEDEKPVWELVTGREFDALRRPLGWSILAGAAIAAYLWVWPPGVVLVGIFGVFLVIHLSVSYARGNSPEPVAFVGAVSLTTAGILQLGAVESMGISATGRTLLHPGLPLIGALGCVFVAWLARTWDDYDQPALAFPGAVFGLVALSAVAVAFILPDIFAFFLEQFDRIFGFYTGTSAAAATVGEISQGSPGMFVDAYGFAAFGALAGATILLVRQLTDDDPSAVGLLLVVWTVFMFSASLTQARFGYYMAVPIGALSAVVVGEVFRLLRSANEETSIEFYQIVTVVSVVLLLVAPMVVGLTARPPMQATNVRSGAGGGVVGWQSSLSWMDDNTPLEGQYDRPDDEPMKYNGVFARTDDYDYPAGAYGVASWWDYGHWITSLGERIPNANPFQQGVRGIASVLLAQNESDARARLSEIDEDDAKTRYVMVDWKMVESDALAARVRTRNGVALRRVAGKFFAPPTWDPGSEKQDYYTHVVSQRLLSESGSVAASTLTMRHKQPYYQSLMVRLYLYHGSSQGPALSRGGPVPVVDWRGQERQVRGRTYNLSPANSQPVKIFPNMSAAESFVASDDSSQIGGFGPYPNERVKALEHYRLVHMSERNALRGAQRWTFFRNIQYSGFGRELSRLLGGNVTRQQLRSRAARFLYPNTPAWTKTFERVPGATVRGTGPENATVTVSVRMAPRNGQPFTYTQRVQTGPNGEFTTTVPYSTTGYENWGPSEGHTNVSVRAMGPYRVTTPGILNESGYFVRYRATVNVSEAKVIGENTDPVTVTMNPQVLGQLKQGNETDGGTSGGSSDGSGSTGGGSSDTGGGSQQSLASPRAGVARAG